MVIVQVCKSQLRQRILAPSHSLHMISAWNGNSFRKEKVIRTIKYNERKRRLKVIHVKILRDIELVVWVGRRSDGHESKFDSSQPSRSCIHVCEIDCSVLQDLARFRSLRAKPNVTVVVIQVALPIIISGASNIVESRLDLIPHVLPSAGYLVNRLPALGVVGFGDVVLQPCLELAHPVGEMAEEEEVGCGSSAALKTFYRNLVTDLAKSPACFDVFEGLLVVDLKL